MMMVPEMVIFVVMVESGVEKRMITRRGAICTLLSVDINVLDISGGD